MSLMTIHVMHQWTNRDVFWDQECYLKAFLPRAPPEMGPLTQQFHIQCRKRKNRQRNRAASQVNRQSVGFNPSCYCETQVKQALL